MAQEITGEYGKALAVWPPPVATPSRRFFFDDGIEAHETGDVLVVDCFGRGRALFAALLPALLAIPALGFGAVWVLAREHLETSRALVIALGSTAACPLLWSALVSARTCRFDRSAGRVDAHQMTYDHAECRLRVEFRLGAYSIAIHHPRSVPGEICRIGNFTSRSKAEAALAYIERFLASG